MEFTEIKDQKQWNDFVFANSSLDILQSWEWGELKKIEGWKPYRFGVIENDEIVLGGMILTKKTPVLGFLAYIPHGPAFNNNLKNYSKEDTWSLFENGIVKWANENNVFAIEIEPKLLEGRDEPLVSILSNSNWKKTGRNRQAAHKLNLNIDRSDEEILGGMDKSTRYNIRYAEKQGVKITKYEFNDPLIVEKFEKFYELMLAMQERASGYPIRSRAYFRRVLKEFKNSNRMVLMEASFEGEVIAMNLSQFTDVWASSFYAGSNRLHPKLKAPYLLRWESVQEAKRRGCTIYDFWGVILNSKQHEGYSKTKLGFGGTLGNSMGIFMYSLSWKSKIWELYLKIQQFLVKLKNG